MFLLGQQGTSQSKNITQHGWGQPAGLGILAAGVIRGNKIEGLRQGAIKPVMKVMAEFETRHVIALVAP